MKNPPRNFWLTDSTTFIERSSTATCGVPKQKAPSQGVSGDPKEMAVLLSLAFFSSFHPRRICKNQINAKVFFFDAMRSIKAPVKSICRSRTWSLGKENSQPFPPPEIQPPRPRCEEFWPLKNRHRNPDGFFWQEIHTKRWMFWKCHLRKNQRITLDWQDAKTAVYFEKISWPGTWSFPTQILLRWKNLNPWTWHFYRENCPFTRVRHLFFYVGWFGSVWFKC